MTYMYELSCMIQVVCTCTHVYKVLTVSSSCTQFIFLYMYTYYFVFSLDLDSSLLLLYSSHPNKSGLSSARKLSESLIDTVKKEYETFKTSQQAPLGFGSTPGYRPPPGMCPHYLLQWNPQIKDTLGVGQLPFIQRLSLSRRFPSN